ncbi:hypothetical protein FJT64_003644 [Amphibalanus amphitrite]|uniref:DNA helicase Pif1-like 2B domain-containing protein n=1 Tax=Amphibalanus amphitrite TaxID=1232801 RepID=A0A6A4VW57_AMPAM|nr:hypothetical protein FJT64_003644 [Amphibalanus amphitrite]
MAQPTGAELVQDLTTMLREQAAAAQEREQRLVSMMEDLLRGQGQGQTQPQALPAASALNMNATIQLGSRRITTEIAVIGELRGALLSWWDSVQLGIFPADYPLQLHQMSLPDCSRTTTARNAAPAGETARGAAAAPPARSAVPDGGPARDVDNVNQVLMEMLPGATAEYRSIDSMTDPEAVPMPTEVLNSLELSGLPSHRLTLKVGAPVILMRNIDAPRTVNGTLCTVSRLHANVLELRVGSGPSRGEALFLPPRTALTDQAESRPQSAEPWGELEGARVHFGGLFSPGPLALPMDSRRCE